MYEMTGHEQNLTLDRRLGRVEVPEVRYRADIDLHDRALAFSSELVRLALAGIAVVGFILTHTPSTLLTLLFSDVVTKCLLSIALVAFAASAGCGLLQRFFAGGAAFHHMQVIKIGLLDDPDLSDRVNSEIEERSLLFARSHRCLSCAAGLLVVAAVFLGAAFVRLLFA